MTIHWQIDAEGLEALEALHPDLVREKARKRLKEAGLIVERQAKQNAPVDRGQLRSSINTQVQESLADIWVEVGPNKAYGPFVEEGTGPHTPPWAPIALWARRHGAEPGAVWWGIRMHGTQAQPYLQPAYDEHEDQVLDVISQTWLDVLDALPLKGA